MAPRQPAVQNGPPMIVGFPMVTNTQFGKFYDIACCDRFGQEDVFKEALVQIQSATVLSVEIISVMRMIFLSGYDRDSEKVREKEIMKNPVAGGEIN